MADAVRQPHPFEQRARTVLPFRRRKAANAQRHFDVFERGELGQQVMKLKNEPNMTVPESHPRRVVHLIDQGISNPNHPGVKRIKPAQKMQQRALAHAGRADDGDHFALFDGQIQTMEHFEAASRGPVRLDEPSNLDKRHAGYWFLSASAGSSRPAWRDGYNVASRQTAIAEITTMVTSNGLIQNGRYVIW
jgi:hypothetical protein